MPLGGSLGRRRKAVNHEPGDLPSTVLTRGRAGRRDPAGGRVPSSGASSPRWRATRRPAMRSLLFGLLGLTLSCAATAAPTTVTDAIGRTVTVERPRPGPGRRGA